MLSGMSYLKVSESSSGTYRVAIQCEEDTGPCEEGEFQVIQFQLDHSDYYLKLKIKARVIFLRDVLK